jgi:ribosomal protein S18 acetylase RimI-like enzyme
MPVWRLIRSGAIRSGLKMAVQLYSKLGPVFKPIELDRKANMKGGPFIYLPALGVASEFQGQGLGGRLLGALIAESEQAGIPLYLETESESNVRWYEKFGFESVKRINLPVINLPMWEMARKPKT